MNADHIATIVDAAALAVDLPLRPEHRPGVLAYFALAAGMAEVVLAVPLARDDESGAVFTPVAPEPADGRR